MKIFIVGLISLCLTSCYIPVRNAWDWLDDPELQFWMSVGFEGYGREFHFQVPDRLGTNGRSFITYPALKVATREQDIAVSFESQQTEANRIIEINWDHGKEGVFGPVTADYKLRVFILSYQDDTKLLDLDIHQRIAKTTADHWETYAGADQNLDIKYWRDLFFGKYQIQPYESSQSLLWTLENRPILVREHEYFRIPISDHHELVFWFWYHWQEEGGRTDPAWLERRKDLSRKILDTVEISPNPWSLKNEAIQVPN